MTIPIMMGATGPSLDLKFTGGTTLDPRATLTRSGAGATCFDATGTLQLAAANAGRFDYGPSPGGATNWVTSSTTQSVSASGATVAASTDLPPLFAGSVINKHIITGTGNRGAITVSIAVGQASIVASVWAYVPASNTAGTGNALYYDIEGTGSNQITTAYDMTKLGTWQRLSSTVTQGAADTAATGVFRNLNTGDVFYSTAYQVESGATPSTYIPTSGAPANVGAVPLGLLIEEGRTNSIRNPRGEGATVGTIGSGGSLPTNWTSATAGNLALAVVGTGTEAGIPYCDIRLFGTANATTIAFINFDLTTAASNGQAWTTSAYVKLQAGSFANLTAVTLQTEEHQAGGTNNGTGQTSLATATAAGLGTQRFSVAYTNIVASTALEYPTIVWAFSNGAVVDLTLRIGAPQMELGGFVTSAILPVVGTPAVTTRAADQAYIPFATVFNPMSGTIYVEYDYTRIPTPTACGISDGTFANSFYITGNNAVGLVAGSGNTATAGTVTSGGTVNKQAASYVNGGSALSTNASATASATIPAGPYPWTLRLSLGCDPWGLSNQIDGHLRRVRYWPRALSAAELQALTT